MGTAFPEREGKTSMDTWIWIVIVVVVALVVIGALAAYGMKRKQHVGREKAEAIRTEAAHRAPELQQADAEAQGAEAEARRMRAEADKLEMVAEERRAAVEEEKSALDERLREADRLDPDSTPGRHTSS